MSDKHNPESGFALLLVYAMAATVAIMLFMELPRVAFEAQRDKEQLLIDRGEQYTRAVNLFVRKFNRYPPDFDALQSTQNLRFLRRKYVDPMTGKDDWRIVHVGPGGVFTDSLIYGKAKTGSKPAEQQNFITELQPTGGIQTNGGQQGTNVGTRQRPSDQAGAPGDPNNPNQPGAPQGGVSQFGVSQPGVPQFAVPQGVPQFDINGQPIQLPNQNGFPGQFQPTPGVVLPGGQVLAGQQFPSGTQFPGGTVTAGQQGGFQPANGPPNAGANLIGQLLTTPRPGGLNGLGGAQQQTVDQNGNPIPNANPFGGLGTPMGPTPLTQAVAAQTIGGGIAGVASKLELEGIKVYKDQTSYHKWEFVYDITKDPARSGGTVPQGGAPPGTPIGANGTPAQGNNPLQNATPTPGTLPSQPPAPPQMPVTPPQ